MRIRVYRGLDKLITSEFIGEFEAKYDDEGYLIVSIQEGQKIQKDDIMEIIEDF